MLRSVRELSGYRIDALDGPAGKLREMYFDDKNWKVRYLVVDTGNWLPGRLVLVSPVAVSGPDWESKSIAVRLSKERIEKSPVADAARPVSRSFEIEMLEYYGWPTIRSGRPPNHRWPRAARPRLEGARQPWRTT